MGEVTYRVRVSPGTRRELSQAALWWAENRDQEQAERWLAGFETAIEGLTDDPERHPLAPENDDFPFTLRQILFGLGRRKTHRAVFEIRGADVIVHGIRHLARRDLNPEDL